MEPKYQNLVKLWYRQTLVQNLHSDACVTWVEPYLSNPYNVIWYDQFDLMCAGSWTISNPGKSFQEITYYWRSKEVINFSSTFRNLGHPRTRLPLRALICAYRLDYVSLKIKGKLIIQSFITVLEIYKIL